MRKGAKLLVVLLLVGLTILSGCAGSNKTKDAKTGEIKYKDGVYEVKTEPDHEGYYCTAKVTIKDGKISNVEWNIYDFTNRIFDEKYEEIYVGNTVYQEQCKNDLKGAATYGPKLVEVQNINAVDAISGATWTNKHFKAAIKLALKKAKL